jgi:ABC-type nitrate/sulfonate/bicarbonate transport system substrate-binding protein
VGEPWNSAAVATGSGWCPALSCDLAPDHPEKVLLTTEAFAQENPVALERVIRALHAACAWCDKKENRSRLVELLLGSGHLRVERDILRLSLIGPFHDGTGRTRDATDFHVFHRRNANEPTRAKSDWLVGEFLKNGLIDPGRESAARAAMDECWRPDLFHRALAPAPASRKRPKLKKKLLPLSA